MARSYSSYILAYWQIISAIPSNPSQADQLQYKRAAPNVPKSYQYQYISMEFSLKFNQ